MPDPGRIDRAPPQVALLQHVLGVGGAAQHLVGEGEEQRTVLDEGVLSHGLPPPHPCVGTRVSRAAPLFGCPSRHFTAANRDSPPL